MAFLALGKDPSTSLRFSLPGHPVLGLNNSKYRGLSFKLKKITNYTQFSGFRGDKRDRHWMYSMFESWIKM